MKDSWPKKKASKKLVVVMTLVVSIAIFVAGYWLGNRSGLKFAGEIATGYKEVLQKAKSANEDILASKDHRLAEMQAELDQAQQAYLALHYENKRLKSNR